MAQINPLLEKLGDQSPYRAKFIEIKEFVEQLMRQQIPQGIQIVVTEESYYTDHGISHIEKVIDNLAEVSGLLPDPLNEQESFSLLVSAYCHDLGMFLSGDERESYETRRNMHHVRSAEILQEWNDEGRISLDRDELLVIKNIVEGHRITDLNEIPEEQRLGSPIRTRLLCALLRVADASHCDHTRAPRAIFGLFYDEIPDSSKGYWRMHFPITDVHFDKNRTAIVVSSNLSGNTRERIEKHRATNLVRRELMEELQRVLEVFYLNNVHLYRVDVKDFCSDKYIEFSELPAHLRHRTNVILGLRSGFEGIGNIVSILDDFSSGVDGVPLTIEICAPEGPLFIDGFMINPDRLEDMKESLVESLGDEFVYMQFVEEAKEMRVST